MSYSYQLLEFAQKDYEDSLNWYGERSTQAADNFVKAVDHALELICNHPDRWRNRHEDFYELGLQKFPFTIIYKIEEDKQLVIIHSLYHHKRNPKKMYRRK